ncbi:MAG: AAA family ATPase [Candidatus Niyogibacteria bacterium]|nr:AAA family ATPase [Candidatus Niyogibacteria bacterium]
MPENQAPIKIPEKLIAIFSDTLVLFPNNSYAVKINKAVQRIIKEKMFINVSKANNDNLANGDIGVLMCIKSYKLNKTSAMLFIEGIGRVVIKEEETKNNCSEVSFMPFLEKNIPEDIWQTENIKNMLTELNKDVNVFINFIFAVFKHDNAIKASFSTNEIIQLKQWLASPTLAQASIMLDRICSLLSIGPDIVVYPKLMEILEEKEVAQRLKKVLALIKETYDVMQALTEEILTEKSQNNSHLRGIYEQKKDKMPAETAKFVLDLLQRFERLNPESAEYAMVQRQLETFLKYPFGIQNDDLTDLKKAEEILNEEHYGLEYVKDIILEYLAARILNPAKKGKVLCFIGPPGTGKTSLGKSIAKATNRKFVRVSLGGVKDEAEIRGHRSTYIGALPGKIIKGMIEAGSENPVFMIDEIDKIGKDYHGDPADTFLEIFDPEQNFNFVDHYFGVGVDLSKVIFISTGNIRETIPEALLDRMIIVEFRSYTEEEKLQIAKKFIIPKQIKECGLTKEAFERQNYELRQIEFSDDAVLAIIQEHTQEAGVRKLEKHIIMIGEKIARIIISQKTTIPPETEIVRRLKEDNTEEVVWQITAENINNYLEEPEYETALPDLSQPLPPGVIPILAVDNKGTGYISFVEVKHQIAEHRELIITGISGDLPEHETQVIKQSVKKSFDRAFFTDGVLEHKDIPENIRVHISFTDGAIPKTGPSAGLAIFLALYGYFNRKSIKPGMAITAEINLVRPTDGVGGIREKSFAAYRANAKEIIISQQNKRALKKIPQSLKEKIKFHLINEPEEAIAIAFPDN